tara:strand:+ start:8844 stop:9731 length:888 start_codon:yes stop_codon:yes gene_type:complete
MEKDTQGNPDAVNDAVFGSDTEDFFAQLESDVNSGIQDTTQNVQQEATPETQDPSQVEQQANEVSQPSDIDNLKKRYSDSSREAQKMRAQLNELKPFMPVLEAMKKDGNLVEHVRGYFEEGGNVPKDVKSSLKLPEDFEFDPDEMVNNSDSDSRKVFDKMVGNIVNKRANEIIQQQEVQTRQAQHTANLKTQAADFIQRHGLTNDEFTAFVNEANDKINTKGMTFDDMYLIMNQNKVNQNVANATKSDMLNQMKNVRTIPTSQSGANSQTQSKNPEDGVFDALKSLDGGLDDMFG